VTKFLPEFKNLKVGILVSGADGKSEVKTEALQREMTIQDLLRHTSGLTYGAEGNNPLKQAYVDANVEDRDQTLAEMVTKLSKLPLIHQPGTTWEYGMSADVLGRIVEVLSGVPLDKFIEERITKPLKLVDTGFSAPEGAADRGARPQKEGPKNQLPKINLVTDNPKWKEGGVEWSRRRPTTPDSANSG
jgi:CubicO group peptidase (beta-lactamase class C family)